ncbi:hypothetical protein HZH68_012328 [Vespula germanica]|uniref:Uncharacterized protein n=1 Tax=Vespula germanica TaxID=30212 RepID=A0A834JH81_VESGE|nr:hypothetical protein HZH68_012328 [Vespula germanica]
MISSVSGSRVQSAVGLRGGRYGPGAATAASEASPFFLRAFLLALPSPSAAAAATAPPPPLLLLILVPVPASQQQHPNPFWLSSTPPNRTTPVLIKEREATERSEFQASPSPPTTPAALPHTVLPLFPTLFDHHQELPTASDRQSDS